MKNRILLCFSAAAILLSVGIHANETAVKESLPASSVSQHSKEEIQKYIENGSLCSDIKGSAYSRGSVIKQNEKFYRCVKVYGENFSENRKLAWVELTMKNGQAIIAD